MTRRACVIGWPLLIPLADHPPLLAGIGIDAALVALPVEPPLLRTFSRSFDSGFVGANVTIPHKQAASPRAPNRFRAAPSAR
jgi:shikimate 5-dehydrogenase